MVAFSAVLCCLLRVGVWHPAVCVCMCVTTQVVRVRFQHIALIASLAGGLAQYHDSLGVGLVDLVLEDVR